MASAADLAEIVSRRSTDLAEVLARHGARFVVVGGTARRLRGGSHGPRDLDVAVLAADVPGLARVLHGLSTPVDAGALGRGRPSSIATGWGPLDAFVVEDLPAADPVDVDGVPVEVARV